MMTLSSGSVLRSPLLGDASCEAKEPPLLPSDTIDCRLRSIVEECVDPGGTVPGGYIPPFFQRTRSTQGSAGRLYGPSGSALAKLGLADRPSELRESS